MDERGRRRIFIAALVLLVIAGSAGLLWQLTEDCGADCGPSRLPNAVADLSWIIAAVIALGLVVLLIRREGADGVASGPAGPNELRGTGGRDDTPATRLDRFFVRLERVGVDELTLLAVHPLDPDAHATATAAALEAARSSGRSSLVDLGRRRVVDWLDDAFAQRMFEPSFVGVTWRHEALRPADRVAVADTLSDAALACVVLDRVEPAIADELIGPCGSLVDGTPAEPVDAGAAEPLDR